MVEGVAGSLQRRFEPLETPAVAKRLLQVRTQAPEQRHLGVREVPLFPCAVERELDRGVVVLHQLHADGMLEALRCQPLVKIGVAVEGARIAQMGLQGAPRAHDAGAAEVIELHPRVVPVGEVLAEAVYVLAIDAEHCCFAKVPGIAALGVEGGADGAEMPGDARDRVGPGMFPEGGRVDGARERQHLGVAGALRCDAAMSARPVHGQAAPCRR